MSYEPENDLNRDPITGTPGSHPVGTGAGAAAGAATGAAVGTAVGGPVGGIVGGTIGAVAGGLAGKGIAEAIDPTGEDLYWRENYATRDYVTDGTSYDTYRPAYSYGWDARRRNLETSWEDFENDLESGWERFENKTELKWEQAKDAVRDGWNRIEQSFDRVFRDEDDYWRESYASRDYVVDGEPYDTYRPAYRYGTRTRLERFGDSWEEIENDLERGWERFKGESKLTWLEAKDAVRDGWHHVERALPGDFDNDGR